MEHTHHIAYSVIWAWPTSQVYLKIPWYIFIVILNKKIYDFTMRSHDMLHSNLL